METGETNKSGKVYGDREVESRREADLRDGKESGVLERVAKGAGGR